MVRGNQQVNYCWKGTTNYWVIKNGCASEVLCCIVVY